MSKNLLDELTLINQDPKPFSEKALAILAGITSFGALFPMFLSNISLFTEIKDPYWPFKVFMALYFLLPLIVLFAWLILSRRTQLLGNPNPVISNSTRLFFIILGVQFVLGIVLVFFHKERMTENFIFICGIVYSLFLLFILSCFFSPIYRTSKVMGFAAIASTGIVILIMLVAIPKYVAKNFNEDGQNTRRSAYKELDKLGKLADGLFSMEESTRSVIERYRLRSRMQWQNSNVEEHIANTFNKMANDPACADYTVKPCIDFFNALILSNDTVCRDNFDKFIIKARLQYVTSNKSLLPDIRSVYNNFIAEKWKPDVIGNITDTPVNSLAYISAIADAVYAGLESPDLLNRTDSLVKENTIDSLFRKYKIQDSTLILRIQFTHFLNELNSAQLYIWLQDFIADAERKTQDEDLRIKKNVAWILRDSQVVGLFIFITLLMSILFYYSVISSIGILGKKNARSLAIKGKANAEDIMSELDLCLRSIEYYLFPVVTFMAIIIALLIPLMKPIEAKEINASRPGWFLSLPNWNVAGAITQSVKSVPVANSETTTIEYKNRAEEVQSNSMNENVSREEFQQAMKTITQKIDETSTDTKSLKQYINQPQ